MKGKELDVLVKASRFEDIASPFVWTVGMGFTKKEIIRIKNKNNKKVVWVEVYNATKNFITNYNSRERVIKINEKQKTLVISEHYRDLLGLNRNEINKIEVTDCKIPLPLKELLAAKYHPDANARLATRLAKLSLILGIISLIGAIPAICDMFNEQQEKQTINIFNVSERNNLTIQNIKHLVSVSGFKSGDHNLPEFNWNSIADTINNDNVLFIIASGFSDPQSVKSESSCNNDCLAKKRAQMVSDKLNSILISPKPIFSMSNGLRNGIKLDDQEIIEMSDERKVKIYIGIKQNY